MPHRQIRCHKLIYVYGVKVANREVKIVTE